MSVSFKTIDLFAGPGGLAEGFSSLKRPDGSRVFDISLSVEKERSAFQTLRLRSFTRQFDRLPPEYYDYISGKTSLDDLTKVYPEEWRAAVDETAMLELGTEEARAVLDPVLARIKSDAAGRTILIGGPPCQAYSLVGRARNRGIKDYKASEDHRHFLYREYIRILDQLQPIAFVMENVKGMLSSKVDGESMIDRIITDLRNAGGGPETYRLMPLVTEDRGKLPGHVIRSEDFGIPQKRHRVILLGIRKDVAEPGMPTLERSVGLATVEGVLAGMPKLRSGLSKTRDNPEHWRTAAVAAFRQASVATDEIGGLLAPVASRLTEYGNRLAVVEELPPRSSTVVTAPRDNRLGAWLSDKSLKVLPNHETRGHMESDLARYAFAATFAEVFGRSPKASEFPADLAPDHRNWESGKFADRFRVQAWNAPSSTVTSHISKDGHYFIHPDPLQCRSLTVREAARLQTFPDNYFFEGNRTEQFVQVGNAVPPLLARQIAKLLASLLEG